MELTPYLVFDGRCAEAFRFYQQCLGGRIVMMQTFADSPAKDHVPPDWGDKVLHTRLEVNGQALMASDAPPGQYAAPQGVSVSISVALSDARRIFDALAEGGSVTMPFAATFWSPGFGMAVDRFGIPWMVNAEPAASAAS